MKAKNDIFKAYDVRGIYPKEINGKIAYEIGAGLVKLLGLKNPKITVGQDLRASSPSVANGFIKGAIDAGAHIIDLGIIITPMLFSSVRMLNADAGAMITASHNPNKYNGIKMIKKDGSAISGESIKSFVQNKKSIKKQNGRYQKTDIAEKYFDEIARSFGDKKISVKNKISIIAKGTAKLFIGKFAEKFKIPVISQKNKKPKFYASFDFDGDRLIIFDKNKKEVRGDIIGAVIGEMIAKKEDKIIYDLRCSKAIPEFFRNKRVKTLISKAGRTYLKDSARKQKAVFGMEITGHYFFKRFNYHESPFFALLKILEKINEEPSLNISEPDIAFKKFFHSGIIDVITKKNDFEQLNEKLKAEYKGGASNNLDGLTIEFSNWWFNLRPSHTEPLMRLAVEANSQKLLDQKKKELLNLLS
ncbi:MAG: hypothetical protein ABIJ28_03340 [Patescibacteria group bacterium]